MASIRKRASGAWQNTSYGIRGTATDTIATLPTTIYSDGTNATVSIKGNTVQSGTPTPENPIMPQGTGDKTVNLFDKNAKNTANGFIQDTMLQPDGTTLAGNVFSVSEYIPVEGDAEYYLSHVMNAAFNAPSLCFYDSSKQFISSVVYQSRYSFAMTAPTTAVYMRISYMNTQAEDVMLNTGSTALPYEPYGYKIPILSADTTTPVYLGEVETTRKIAKYVITGNEAITFTEQSGLNRFAVEQSFSTNINRVGICSHYKYEYANANLSCYIATGGSYLFIFDNDYSTAADFKTYLQQQYAAGTPVTVWYVLANEETAVVNEPLMKIDSYADEVNGISIPTTDGATTLSIDTTVQPSEVSVNYHVWHMGTVHERVSGEWD